jgi:hypothetical protein
MITHINAWAMCLFFNIMLDLFNNDHINNNDYLLGTLWPYLVRLFEAPNTCSYVGSHHHG